ncbi:MAG: hypothetical protein ACRC3Y_10580, partial [Romboutsia sp.]|uniref:hypothetical protein n=1 Tax=Romboutsia sp. TaxID=1965302 RepID=UPI003F2A2442
LDFTYKSDEFVVDFISKMNDDNFKITTLKDKYFIDEDICFNIRIENNSIYEIENVKISDYIPKNTVICSNSIVSSSENNLNLKNDIISIDKINSKESIDISFNVNILPDKDLSYISCKPRLNYIDKSSKEVLINANSIKVDIDTNNIVNNNDFVYEIDKNEGFVNDIINHTLTISNPTKTDVHNLKLIANNFDSLEFIENSLIVNDIYQIGENLNRAIKLGDLDSGEYLVIKFQTKVISLNNLDNMFFNLDYETLRRNISQYSNNQEFKVLSPVFNEYSFKKTQSSSLCNVEDIIDITIEAMNVGNFKASNVIIKDSLPSGLEFINYSLYINDKNENFNPINDGVPIGYIKPQEKVVICYKARAVDILPSENTSASIYYSYNNEGVILQDLSNEVNTTVIGARIGNNDFDICLSNYTAQIGDIITCMLSIENTGSIDCESIKIYHPINSALEFIDGSLIINGNHYNDDNIFNGIMIDRINSNKSLNISYQVKVIDFPRPNPISEKVTLEYSFIFEDTFKTETICTNRYKLYVNNPSIGIVDKNSTLSIKDPYTFKKVSYNGDYIFFNLEMQNRGNVGLEDLCLKLNLPKDLELDEDSIKINNGPCKNLIGSNILLPNLNVSQIIHVEFFAKHTFIEQYNLESNFTIDYSFRDLKTQAPFKKTQKFKENILIINPNIEINKFVVDKSIDVNKEFTKNINIKNTGNVKLLDVNLDLNENEFLDKCSKVIFMNGSYIEDSEKLYIDEINVGETVNLAIRYKVADIVSYQNFIPKSIVSARYILGSNNKSTIIKKESNSLQLNIRNLDVSVESKCNNDTVMLNSINKYILTLTNLGNSDCNSVKLNVSLPNEVSYVENSFCINSRNTFVKKLSPKIDIGDLKVNESKNISLDFIVSNLPYQNQLRISSNALCEYVFDEEFVSKEFESDLLLLEVENVSIDIIKIASPQVLQADDTLQVQTIINNLGTTEIKNLFLQDNLNKNLNFIEGSVFIDGENFETINPVDGINLSPLDAGSNLLLTYEYKYVPTVSANKIMHFSDLSYVYTLKDKTEDIVNTKSEIIYLEGALSTFKEFSMENEYHLKDFEPDIGEVINTFTNATIEEYYEINSIKNVSIDNVSSTGKKVILKGFIVDRIEYLTSSEYSSLYMLERTQPFSIFINLPIDYDCEEINFTAKCDNIFYKTLGKRDIFVSSLISIEGSL